MAKVEKPSNDELDKIIAALKLTPEDANRIDNAGYVNTNGYVPQK